MISKGLFSIAAAFAFIVIMISCSKESTGPADNDTNHYPPEVGNKASYFELEDINGKTLKLNEYTGNVIVLDFWASWCGPCMKEVPDMKKLWAKFKGRNFKIIGISADQYESMWKKAIADSNMSWIHVWDKEGTVGADYKANTIPRIFIIDKKRTIRVTGHPGMIDMETEVGKLLDE